jgi:hypothetical protein
MSTLISKVGNYPLCHMTSDTKTQAELEVGPISSTLFHSDLPYVFAREQFELTSYTTWSGSDGGRTFSFTQELIDFKQNNPDLACLIVLEDSAGSKTLFTPTPIMTMGRAINTFYNCSVVGQEYSCAATNSDSQLSSLSRQTINSNYSFATTFYTFDTNDTRITVFKHNRFSQYNCDSSFGSVNFYNWQEFIASCSYANWICISTQGVGDLRSNAGVDIVKIKFIFLNIENSTTTFNRQSDYNGTSSITIRDNQFSVGNIDLIKNAPIISHGLKNTTDTVSPIINGSLVGGAIPTFTAGASFTTGKVTSSGGITRNNTPVIEIPSASNLSTTMEFDFVNKVFNRDGEPVFSAAAASAGLQVIGTTEVEFSMTTGTVYESQNTTSTIATDTGSFSGAGSNTLYLASLVYIPAGSTGTGDHQNLPSCLFAVGNNILFHLHWHVFYTTSVNNENHVAATWYCNIDSSGNITIKRNNRSCNFRNFSSINVGEVGSFKLRLIAMDS